MQGLFVAGIDTDVGKTVIASGMLHALRRGGDAWRGLKPVASGARSTPDGLRNEDAEALLAASASGLCYEDVNPWVFAPAIAPHLAATGVGVHLGSEAIKAHIESVDARLGGRWLVEGAGGWRVPLNDRECFSDLAIALGLPVLLVVAVRLGCINHALLSAEAIRRDGLLLAGWVANNVSADPANEGIIATLKSRLDAPCVGCVPRLPEPSAAAVAGHLDVVRLSAALA